MPKFGSSSRRALTTAHPDLQKLFNEVIKEYDIKVTCGHRNRADQDKAVNDGASKAVWPTSKHNKVPSLAVDVYPYPIDFHNESRFFELAPIVKRIAKELGIKVKWGGDFKATKNLGPGWDKPHWELV